MQVALSLTCLIVENVGAFSTTKAILPCYAYVFTKKSKSIKQTAGAVRVVIKKIRQAMQK
jgi:hypothetical protein